VTDAAAGRAAPRVIALNDGGIELDGRSIGQATPQRGNPFLLPSLDAELRRLPAPTSSRVVIHVPCESAYQEVVPLMFTAGQAEYSKSSPARRARRARR
jgi:hypothetical protein